jgi:hypothetical protein
MVPEREKRPAIPAAKNGSAPSSACDHGQSRAHLCAPYQHQRAAVALLRSKPKLWADLPYASACDLIAP